MAYLATIAAFGFEDFDPPTLLPIYRRLGCTAMQFYRNTIHPPSEDEARRVAGEVGMPFDSVHGVFGTQHDPSSPHEAVRREAVEAYRAEGHLVQDLGGTGVVVHPAPPVASGEPASEEERAHRVEPMRQTMKDLARTGRKLGVTYLFENIPADYRFGSDPAQLAELIREIDDPHVRMCFDTGHAHMTGDAVDAFRACRDVIGYVHVHDNDGVMDNHRIPGDGTIRWDALRDEMAKLPRDMPVMLELFFSEEEMVDYAEQGLGPRVADWLAINHTAPVK